METYKFIKDEQEMQWFFDHVLDNLNGDKHHSYLACIATRSKKLTEDERKHYGISGSDGVMLREEIIAPRGKDKLWNFAFFKQHIARYECNKDGMLTRTGLPYPDKALSVMIYAEPSDERKVANYIQNYYNGVMKELADAVIKGSQEGVETQINKLTAVSKKSKSCHAVCTDHRFIHFDFDIRKDLIGNEAAEMEALNVLRETARQLYGPSSVFIIRTAGGFHCLLKRDFLKNGAIHLQQMTSEQREATFGSKKFSDPVSAYEKLVEENYSYTFEPEEKRKDQVFVPIPGTIMYGKFVPYVANKEDF